MKTWVEVAWVSSLSGAITLFGVLLGLTPITRGLGIDVDEGGRFFLKQGLAEMAIPQWFGFLLFVLTHLLGLCIVIVVILAIPTFLKHGTLKVGEILDESSRRDRALLGAFQMAWIVAAAGFAVSAFTLFLSFLGL